MTLLKYLLTLCIVAGLILTVGCSDSDSPTSGGTGSVSDVAFADYLSLVQDVAPPVYSAPASAPTAIDSLWDSGDYPLLGKVFSETEPMSLYSNVGTFDNYVMSLEDLLRVDDSTGEYLADSSWMTVTDLSSPVAFPAVLQPVFGNSVELDQYVSVIYPDTPEGWEMHLGFAQSDSVEIILAWTTMPSMDSSGGVESNFYFANFFPVDSTFFIKGATVKHGVDTASWIYDISSNANNDFEYRMSWFSTEIPEGTLLGTIIGGGNKDTEFALKYRQWIPADSSAHDTLHMSEQLFGPNYTEGTGLISSYDEYLNDSLIITYSETPREQLPSPFVQ